MKAEQPNSAQAKQRKSAAPRLRRLDALCLLLGVPQLKESFALSAQASLRLHSLAGLQAAVTALIALPAFGLSPWTHLMGFAALGAPIALFGRFTTRRTPLVSRCALLQTSVVFLMSAVSWLVEPLLAKLIILALVSGVLFFIAASARLGLPGPLIFVFGASACIGEANSWHVILEQTAATGVVAGLAIAICYLTEIVRDRLGDKTYIEAPLQSLRHRTLNSAKVAAGAAMATLLAYGLTATHPGWAAVGLVAVMQGTHLHINMNRAVQRTLGTACGAMIAWPILAYHPSVWMMILMLSLLMFLTEVIIGWNYALGQFAVTPMALVMSQLSAPNAVTVSVVPERVFDTLLGAGTAIVIAVVCSTMEDRIDLANHSNIRSDDKPTF